MLKQYLCCALVDWSKKRLFLLLQILDLLHQRKKVDFKLQIVGSGPLKKALAEEINRIGLSACVELVGSKSEQEVSAFSENRCYVVYWYYRIQRGS